MRNIDYMRLYDSCYDFNNSEFKEALRAEKIAFDAEVEREHIAREKEEGK